MLGCYQSDLVAHVRCVGSSSTVTKQLLNSYIGGSCVELINIFEVFLPQLLRYPNPNDPLNGEAAALLMRHPKEYDAKVRGKPCLNDGTLPAC